MRARAHSVLLVAALALVCLVWGSTWYAIKISLRDLPPLTAAALRFLLAAGLIMATAGRRRLPAGDRHGTPFWLLLGACMIGIPYACVYWGETTVPSGLTAVLFATYPLFVAMVAHIGVPGERLTLGLVAGLVAGFAGVFMLFSGDIEGTGLASISGGILVLISAASSAVATVLVKTRLAHLDPLLINLRPMFYGGLMLLLAAMLTERTSAWNWTPQGITALLYLVVFGSVVAFSTYAWLMRTIAVSRLAFVTYVTPVVALALGHGLADEPLTPRLAAGTALVIGGVILARRRARR